MPTVVKRRHISIWEAAALYETVPIPAHQLDRKVPSNEVFPLPHASFEHSTFLEPVMLRLNDALLLPDGSVVTDEHYIFKGLTFVAPDGNWTRFAPHIVSMEGDIVEVRCPDRVDDLRGSCYQLNTGHRRNFAHFEHDVIARIYFMKFCPNHQDLDFKIVTSVSAFPIQDYVLEHIFQRNKIVFQANNSIRAEECFLSCLPIDTKGLLLEAFLFAHELQCNIGPFSVQRNRRIYVSRADGAKSSGRDVSNEGELVSVLNNYGFESVEVSKLSPEEIVSTFKEASVIVGVHGAGLMNFMFASTDSIVIELALIGSTHPFISKIGGLMGYRYNVLPMISENGASMVDINLVEHALAYYGISMATSC